VRSGEHPARAVRGQFQSQRRWHGGVLITDPPASSSVIQVGKDAARKIGIGNANANNLKALLPDEQQIAETEAYKPPSTLGQVFSGAGGMLGSCSGTHVSPNGAQLPFGAGSLFAPTPSSMLG
jgi:hypothetical protein